MVDRFETTNLYKEMYKESLSKNELSPADLLIHTLAASFLETGFNSASSEADWMEEGDKQALGLNKSARLKMYKQARRLALLEPIAQGVLRKFLIYICANGPTVSLSISDAMMESRLKTLFPHFGQLARHIIARTFIHGEYYMLHFPLSKEKWGFYPQLRSILPDYCSKIVLQDEWSDIPVIEGYKFNLLRDKVKAETGKEILSVENVTPFVIHQELNDSLHGLSLFYVLMKELPRYINWLDSRELRAKADALFLIIRYLKGASQGEISELPDRPMIIDAHMDHEEWKPLTTMGAGRDAAEDGYEFRLRVAQGVGLPEHDVSGNAKFAGQMGRDAFPTRLYEYYQSLFEGFLKSMVAKTIGTEQQNIAIHWPLVDTRDRGQLVTEQRTLAADRIISRAEVHRRLNYDHERIEQELQDEIQQAGLPAPGGVPLDLLNIPLPESPPVELQETEVESPKVEVILPSAETNITVLVPPPVEIIDEVPDLTRVGLAFDYGYADKGAGVVGGLTLDRNLAVVGEIQLIQAELSKWVDAANQVKERYPKLEAIWTGSDSPELVDALQEAGFTVIPKYLEKEVKTQVLQAFSEDRPLLVHRECQRTLNALVPEVKEIQTKMHSKPERHHFDALIYLLLGMLKETKNGN